MVASSGREDALLVIREVPRSNSGRWEWPRAAPPEQSCPLSSLLRGGSRGLWALRGRKTNGFNVYHPKVQCHGNSGTLDSPSTSGGGVGRAGGRGQALPLRGQLLQLEFSVWVQGWNEHVMRGQLRRPESPPPSSLKWKDCHNGQWPRLWSQMTCGQIWLH